MPEGSAAGLGLAHPYRSPGYAYEGLRRPTLAYAGQRRPINISNSINSARYSNKFNSVKLVELDEINKVLTIDLPIKLTRDMNHLVLSQKFAKLIISRSVWVYENEVLVSESHFQSYAEAQAACVARNITAAGLGTTVSVPASLLILILAGQRRPA